MVGGHLLFAERPVLRSRVVTTATAIHDECCFLHHKPAQIEKLNKARLTSEDLLYDFIYPTAPLMLTADCEGCFGEKQEK